MKKIVLIFLMSVLLFGCSNGNNVQTDPQQTDQTNEDPTKSEELIYKNTEYGFDFTLPDSWKGYTIITDEWEGFSLQESEEQKVTETGPLISIRHPEWSSENPRQDIPIMVFTLSQWDNLQKDEFHIGAAPINPSEIARNTKYVFALPARYNFAFPAGYEEVEDIMNSKPLNPIEDFSSAQ
ncbi:PsbP-related protein [Clostridium aminobutyricum]|uniref:Lipoprotein n=1 Tax=Clostridium aminobutyricum TaxID=33953 RepID=A0A939DA84_CLOAM|nr:hypothetical protein [Clostridium aminobutyricum]MBN7773618.1 hypothetical protein [Clostridium aminobutyricum]